MTPSIGCREAIAIIADLLDQSLPPGERAGAERHLRACHACRAYLDTYRKTRRVVGAAGRVEMPAEAKSRLRRFLIAHF